MEIVISWVHFLYFSIFFHDVLENFRSVQRNPTNKNIRTNSHTSEYKIGSLCAPSSPGLPALVTHILQYTASKALCITSTVGRIQLFACICPNLTQQLLGSIRHYTLGHGDYDLSVITTWNLRGKYSPLAAMFLWCLVIMIFYINFGQLWLENEKNN